MSFGAFKQKFFSSDFLTDGDGRHLAPRVQVNITYHRDYEKVKQFIGNLLNVILELFTMHRRAEKKAFELRDFLSELNERLGEHAIDRNQAGLLLDMLAVEASEKMDFQKNKSFHKILQKRKQQKKPEASEYVVLGNYSSIKGNIMKLLFQCRPGENMQYRGYFPFLNRPLFIMPVLTLLEITDQASYDLKGGESAEIFLRINDPYKIERLAYGNYQNEVLQEIKRKHRDNQELLHRFFTCRMTDEQRWDFIESYFLGREEELNVCDDD